MAISRQWTEWHLTPRGWVSGSSRRDGEGNVWRDEPEDRIVTFAYQEQIDKAHPEPHVTVQESWRSKAVGAGAGIDDLLIQHGIATDEEMQIDTLAARVRGLHARLVTNAVKTGNLASYGAPI